MEAIQSPVSTATAYSTKNQNQKQDIQLHFKTTQKSHKRCIKTFCDGWAAGLDDLWRISHMNCSSLKWDAWSLISTTSSEKVSQEQALVVGCIKTI
jgi:hypothetical protein